MSFTPGPWHTTHDSELVKNGVYAGEGDDIIICDVTNEDVQNDKHFAANARLIAAAPDLLAALEQTRDWLLSFSMPPSSTIQEKQEHLAIIEAAIAHARDGK